jgi:hypothetical protein
VYLADQQGWMIGNGEEVELHEVPEMPVDVVASRAHEE